MRRIAQGLAFVGMSAAGLGLLAIPASAHVTVAPATATKGGYATLTFKVPTEREDASTTKVEVDFPEGQPLPGASVQPKAGWDYSVEKVKLANPITAEDGDQITDRVAKIIWTAKEGSAIKPGEFDTFPVSAGPLPENADSMVFKAIQTYSNGEIVRWIEEAAEGSAEPKNPAPKITLTDAPKEGASATPGASASSSDPELQKAVDSAKAAADAANKAVKDLNASLAAKSAPAAASDAPTKNQVDTAVGLAIGAIVLALVGAGIGGAALAKRSGPAGPPTIPPAV